MKYVILKLDTPCTLVESAMRVPTAEPLNFAKALIDACPEDAIDVCMLGHAAKSIEYGQFGTIRTIPYFGEPKSIKDEFDESTRIIVWQGRHIMGMQAPSVPTQIGTKPSLVNPYSAGDFERLCLVKIWQVQMYNLLSSTVIPQECKKYFLVTDIRLPLIDLHKIDPVSVPKPLPNDIILITQAKYHEQYNKWQYKYCNGMSFPEIDIQDYMYQFKNSIYLPLHALPIMSHKQFAIDYADKTQPAIFQVQSIKYVDDYRKQKLREALKFVSGYCTLHGRFRNDEKGIVVSSFPEYSDILLSNLIDNSDNPSECFFDSAQILAKHQASLIITDRRYARFGLCPNRFVEALAVNTVPLVVKDALDNCDDTIKECMQYLDIKPEYTQVTSTGDVNKPYVFTYYDANRKQVDIVLLQSNIKICIDKLYSNLMQELRKFILSA